MRNRRKGVIVGQMVLLMVVLAACGGGGASSSGAAGSGGAGGGPSSQSGSGSPGASSGANSAFCAAIVTFNSQLGQESSQLSTIFRSDDIATAKQGVTNLFDTEELGLSVRLKTSTMMSAAAAVRAAVTSFNESIARGVGQIDSSAVNSITQIKAIAVNALSSPQYQSDSPTLGNFATQQCGAAIAGGASGTGSGVGASAGGAGSATTSQSPTTTPTASVGNTSLPTVDATPNGGGTYTPEVRPTTIQLSGDATNIVSLISWSNWNQQGAVGTGTVVVLPCNPALRISAARDRGQ